MTIITDPRCTEYSKAGHPERPQRIARTVERLKAQTELPLQWAEPLPVEDEIILRAHSRELLRQLGKGGEDFDSDTPAHPGIHEHARRSAGGALAALREARAGRMALSLLRPPGHHATRERMMGFCYLNSIAIAVLDALANGFSRVAVFDFDVHHGNGTEDILMGRPHCLFCSVHQHPAYPGTGAESRENCRNFSVPPGSTAAVYRDACSRAMERIREFKPDLIAVSAGFDSYRRDLLAQQNMEEADFRWLGESIRQFGVPTFSVLEGGYSSDLPDLILAYLKGLAAG